MGKFLIKKLSTGYKFHLMTLSGEQVATGEVYTTKAACRKGIQGIAAIAPTAPAVDADAGETASNPKFEYFCDKTGKFRFRLLARNGKIVAVSTGYRSRENCLAAIEAVRAIVQRATVEDL